MCETRDLGIKWPLPVRRASDGGYEDGLPAGREETGEVCLMEKLGRAERRSIVGANPGHFYKKDL